MAKVDLTAERLREILYYDPLNGVFLRRVNSRRRKNMLVPAGTFGAFGHIAIYVEGFPYQAHRLAWLYVYGQWPSNVIDHINGDPADNKISNLRSVSQLINAQNRRNGKIGKSTPLGVSTLSRNIPKRFTASITANAKRIFLGYFATPEEAHLAYITAKRIHHEGCTI